MAVPKFGARMMRSSLESVTYPLIIGETLALTGSVERPLLHNPVAIRSVYSFNESAVRTDYVEGVDFEITATGIRRLTGSDIYDFAGYSINMNGPGGTSFIRSDDPRNPPLVLHKQAYVDYEAVVEPETITALAAAPFTGNILCCGDSITAAADTITQYIKVTDIDGYVGKLRNHFRNSVDVRNFSLGGSSADMLVSAIDGILAAADRPSAIVVAYGMNDHTFGLGTPLTTFENQIDEIVDKSLTAGTIPILVGFFKKNSLWVNYDPASIAAYNDALADIAATYSIGFVDIKTIFDNFGTVRNRILELTGDNFHHPNNFGQRIYFSAILPHLISDDLNSADLPDYVIAPS